MFSAWQSTQKALASYGGVSGAIAILANIIYGLIEIIIVLVRVSAASHMGSGAWCCVSSLWSANTRIPIVPPSPPLLPAKAIYDVSFYSVYLPISTIILSLSFALGSVVGRTIDNLLFVLVSCPYENGAWQSCPTRRLARDWREGTPRRCLHPPLAGDRVCCDGVAANAVLTVLNINFSTTEFCDMQGRRIVKRNNDLNTMAIMNLVRACVDVWVAMGATHNSHSPWPHKLPRRSTPP